MVDLFSALNPDAQTTSGDGLKATLSGDLSAEFETTESCAETGCGGGPLGP